MMRSVLAKLETLTAVSLTLLFFLQTGCTRTGKIEQVTIAVSRQPISAPVYIAQDLKLFEREGLQVSLQQYWTGKEALESVIAGKSDFCTVAETPAMFAALKNEPIFIIATIGDSDRYMKIIARRDRNILDGRDLKGKKIGVSPGTNAEYFLDAYLAFSGISKEQIHRISLKPEMMTDALVKGNIDAAVSWDPHAENQQKKLSENAVLLENEQIYQMSWNIVARREQVKGRPETVQKLLRALVQAQNYIADHPQEARKITAGYVGNDDFNLADFNFDVRLGQSLVLHLEEQARWAIKSGLTDKKEVPNFLNFLYFEGMEAVAPDSVTVWHK